MSLTRLVQFSLFLCGAFSYPHKALKLSDFDSNLQNVSDSDFFWYTNDLGKVVPAILKGGPAPATPQEAEDNVEFWLYRNGKEPGVRIRPDCSDCLSTFMAGAPLVILSHGFGGNHEGGFGETHRGALSQRSEPTNVIFINWGKLAVAPWYETAANNVGPVGSYTGRMLNFIIQKGLISHDKIHFVGHSLGAHVGNFISASVANGKIARITALDPALPLFGIRDDSKRIDPSDALFVDVIHTAMGVLPEGLAFTEPRGHVDFYPNSGKNQPGCGMDAFGSCSHGRANSFFAESVINPKAFLACKCNSWDEYTNGKCLCLDQEFMGWATLSSSRGLYYLRTNAKSPFGQG